MGNRITIEKDSDWLEEGWTSVPNRVLRDASISFAARGMFAYLASHSPTFTVTIATLMAAGGCGRHRVQALLRELEQAGYLSRKQGRDELGTFENPVFWLHTRRRSEPVTENQTPAPRCSPVLVSPPQTDPPQAGFPPADDCTPLRKLPTKKNNSPTTVDQSTSNYVEVKTSLDCDEVSACDSSSSVEDQEKTVKSAGQLASKRSNRVEDQKTRSASPSTRARQNATSAFDTQVHSEVGFDEFWKVYPRKVAKEGARRAYAKAVRKADPFVIMTAVKRYAEAVAGMDKTYVKHPTTWLNQGCWDDEDLPHRPKSWTPYRNPVDDSIYEEAWA